MESDQEINQKLKELGCLLRLFERQDEDALHAIFIDVVDAGDQFPYDSSTLDEFRKQFFHDDGYLYVCCSEENEVVGGFYLRPNGSETVANAAYMIKRTHRGKGIGSLLIKASLHLAKKHGFEVMQYNMVIGSNTVAINLYKKLGFEIVEAVTRVIPHSDNSPQEGYTMLRKLD